MLKSRAFYSSLMLTFHLQSLTKGFWLFILYCFATPHSISTFTLTLIYISLVPSSQSGSFCRSSPKNQGNNLDICFQGHETSLLLLFLVGMSVKTSIFSLLFASRLKVDYRPLGETCITAMRINNKNSSMRICSSYSCKL